MGNNEFLGLIATREGRRQAVRRERQGHQSNGPNQLAANLRARRPGQARPDRRQLFDSVETISGLVEQAQTRSRASSTPTDEKAPDLRGILFKENQGIT